MGEGQETRDERRQEIAVDRVRDRLIVIELVGTGADCALVGFLNDAKCDGAGQTSRAPARHGGADRIGL